MRTRGPILAAILGLLSACPSGGDVASLVPDQSAMPTPDAAVPAALFEDCTPPTPMSNEIPCADGLRCGIVQVGEPPYDGAISQCVPLIDKPLAEGDACAIDQMVQTANGVRKRFDRCAPGLACVPTARDGLRCRRLCHLRVRSGCKDAQLCVLPSPVSSLGYCATADRCEPVFPQTGCPLGERGQVLGCYVLGDDKGSGVFCLSQEPYGDSSGALDSPCERSVHCQQGLGCFAKSGSHQSTCRPYCALPTAPDGGTPPDAGDVVRCPNMLGICSAIAGYPQVGRCL